MTLPYDVVTFDCYGTLVDWEAGIVEAFTGAAPPGTTVDAAQVLRLHAEIEPAVQAGPYRSYRTVLEDVARTAAERLGWSLSPAAARFLPDSLAAWPPFADTNPALERLVAAGARLGILSNVDDALLAGTLQQLTTPFDPIVTAEQVRSYKPARPHFARARALLDGARWLHVAQSWFHDVAPAHAFGVPVVWVNRKDELPGKQGEPLAVVRDLAALVGWLEETSDG